MQTDVSGGGSSPTVAGDGAEVEKRPFRTWLLVALWAAVIFGLSSLPGSRIPAVRFAHFDKVVHFALYATLGVLLGRALGLRWPRSFWAVLATGWLLAVAYGASDEIHQLFVAGRSADPADLAADAVGALVGVLASLVLRRRRASARS
jgi:VanZ family protein